MKTSTSIFSYLAVFAVGAALSFVIRHQDADHSGKTEAAVSARVSSGHTATNDGSGADARSPRSMKRDAAERGSKASASVTVRLGEINRIGEPLERQAALMELIARLGSGEFEAFAEQYRSMEHFGNTRDEFEMILRGWAKADPLAALAYTAKQPNSREQTSAVLSTWAANDAAAAEKWAAENFKGDGPNPWMAAVIRGIATYDVALASKLTAAMPKSEERGEAMNSITRALLVQGTETAMAYPSTIQDPGLRAGYISMIADRIADRNPEQAASWLASMNDADAQSRGARHVAEALAQQDLTKAAEWVRKLSPEAQAEAARGVIIPMSRGDIPGTAKWVSTLSGIPNYDSVVEEYVWSCDYRSPEQSAAWIQGISDPEQRTRLYHRMLGEWAKRDAPAVKNWVANNTVPQSVTRRFAQ
jgi:hypothetical protein